MKKNKINLKQTFQKLEDILNKLESPDIDIDSMVELYEEGVKIAAACKKKLDVAEQKITVLKDSK